MTRTPSLRTLAAEHTKRLAKHAASAPLKPQVKPPTLGLGGNSGVAKIPSLMPQPKIPTLSTKPVSNVPQLGEGTAQQVQQTAQNLQPQQQQQAPAPTQQPVQAPVQAPVQPQAPQPPLGPLGVPPMSKTGFLGHWAASGGRSQGVSGAAPLATPYRASVSPWSGLAAGVEGLLSEDGKGFGKVGNETTGKKQALVAPIQAKTSSLFKRGFEELVASQGVATRLLRQWYDMGLRGAKLAAAIEKAASMDSAVKADFLKLADNSPLKMDPAESPLKTDSPGAPKLNTTPDPAKAAPPKPNPAPGPTPGPKPAPIVAAPTQSPTAPAAPTQPAVPAGEFKPPGTPDSPGGAAKVEPDYAALNGAYGQANTTHQQAHAKWLELHRTKPGTPEEAAAWEALPGLQQKIDQAHQARVPYMGPEYASAKTTMDQAGATYDQLIAQGVPNTDPKYQAAAKAYHDAKATHDQFVQRGLAPTQQPVSPGAAKPDPNAADPFAGYGEDQPDPNAYKPGSAPRWSNMFQKAPGQDLHAFGNHQPVKDLYQQWGGDYQKTVTKGLQEKFLPWMQQTGGAGLDEWAGAMDPHQRTTVRLGLSDELVRVQKELGSVTAWAKDPNKVKEYEQFRPTILDPSKRPMFDQYAQTKTAYQQAEAAWMDKYKQGVDDPTLWAKMVQARGEVDKMSTAGVNDASHHWYQQTKKAGELTAAKQAYQQAYAQINYADFGSAAPVDLKAGLTAAEQQGPAGNVKFREAMRGTEKQRAAYLSSLDYGDYRKEMEEEAKAEAQAEAERRAGPGTTMGGDVAAKYYASKKKIYDDTLKARLSAIPDEANFYHGRNLIIQHAASGDPAGFSPKGWEGTTAGWFRPKQTKRELVKPQENYPRGGMKSPAVYKDVVTDQGQVNPYQSGARHFYDRYVKPVAGQSEADVAGYQSDMYSRKAATTAWAAGFTKADDATRAGYADRLSPTDRTVLINDLVRSAQTSAQSGDHVTAENSRKAAVFLSDRFNSQLKEFSANPHNQNLVKAWEQNGGQWVDKGTPKEILAHMNTLNPAMRGHVDAIGNKQWQEYYREMQRNKDPRYQLKYDPAFGYEFIDRSVLNAGAMMAPVYRTAARGVGAISGDGPGRDWLGGDTAQMKFIMDNPDKAHLIDWSGKPREISMKAEDVALDGLFSALTLLPVGTAANMGRGMATTVGGMAGASTAMAGVEIAPIDQKYKPGLRVVAGLVGGVGGGAGGNLAMGAAQQSALRAFGQTGMVRATSTLAKVETEVAKLTSAGKPIPADLVAKQQAARAELDTLRAAGGDKLVAAESAQKAALERVAAIESRMKDATLSPAYRRAMASSPEYKEAVKNLRAAEKEMYGVYKGLDAAKAGPASATKAPAGVADDVASAKAPPAAPAAGAVDDAAAAGKGVPPAAGASGAVDDAAAAAGKGVPPAGAAGAVDDAAAAGGGVPPVPPGGVPPAAAGEAGKSFLGRWGSGWTDRNAWRDGLGRWTKGLSPAEVLKRRAESTAGPKSTAVSNLNLSYNAERVLNQGLQYLPEAVARPLNAAFRTVATPFRYATGEGAFFNAFRHRAGRAGGYGTAPFMPYIGNKLDESRVKKPEMTPGNLVASFMPWTNWPAQFGTTAYDQITGAKPGTGLRDKQAPTMLDEWGNNFKALGVTKDTLADLAAGSETAKIKMRRASEELPSFFKNKATGILPGANTPDMQISQARARMAELETRLQGATGDEEKLRLQAEIDNEKSIIETNKNQREARPTSQIRQAMVLEDKLEELKGQQAALVQQHGEAAQQMPQFQKLQGDIDYVQKEYEKTDLNQKEKEWIGRERRDLDQYKSILDRTGGPPTQAELDPKYQFPSTMEGRSRRAAVEAWKAKTSVTNPALSALGGAQPGAPGSAGARDGFTDEEYGKFEGDFNRALVAGDPNQAKAVFDAALKRAGGDTSKLPMGMLVKDMDHSMFPNMAPEQYGAMIDQGLGAGTYQKYSAVKTEAEGLAQKVQALQNAGQPVPPALMAEFQQKAAPYEEMRKKVQGQALAHYENTVMKDLREAQVPTFQKEYDEIKKIMGSRPPGSPLDPDTQARLVAMREKGQAITQQYTDFAMRKAVQTGGFKEDGTPIKTVQDFLGEANRTTPVLGADGQPLKQLVRQPDGSVVEQAVTEPASPIGKEIKARIDSDILQRIQGQQVGVDAQGRPVMEHQVPPEVGAGIFGNMTSMEKMLTFGGLGLGVVGLMGAMFGFGGAWLPILGLLGAAFGGHKATGGDLGKLFKKDFWLEATKSQKSRDGEVLNRFADAEDSFTGQSPMGQVGLDNLKQLPQYADMVAGKMPSRQAVQYLAALQPQDRVKLQAELQASQPNSPLLPMIKQVDTFHSARQGDLQAEKAMQAPAAAPGAPPKPGQPAPPAGAPAGMSKATTMQQFAAENGVPMKGNMPDLAGMAPDKIGAMVARMPPRVRAEAAAQLDQSVMDKVTAKMPSATQQQAWDAVQAAANDPDDKNYHMARQAVQMRKLLAGR